MAEAMVMESWSFPSGQSLCETATATLSLGFPHKRKVMTTKSAFDGSLNMRRGNGVRVLQDTTGSASYTRAPFTRANPVPMRLSCVISRGENQALRTRASDWAWYETPLASGAPISMKRVPK